MQILGGHQARLARSQAISFHQFQNTRYLSSITSRVIFPGIPGILLWYPSIPDFYNDPNGTDADGTKWVKVPNPSTVTVV